MKIVLLSDLHLEFQRYAVKPKYLEGVDLVICAGDIDSIALTGGFRAKEFFDSLNGVQCCVALGNHDLYGTDLHLGYEEWTTFLKQWPNIHLLNRDFITVGGYRVAGASLWTSFELDGTPGFSAEVARLGIADFGMIRYRGGPLQPQNLIEHHIDDVGFLKALVTGDSHPTIVVTHFVPLAAAIAPQWQGSKLNPYFTTDQVSWLARPSVPLCCFGHTHSPFDQVIGTTRFACNPRGYPNEIRRKHYVPQLIELQ